MNAAVGEGTERPGDYLNTPAAAREFGVDVAVADEEAEQSLDD